MDCDDLNFEGLYGTTNRSAIDEEYLNEDVNLQIDFEDENFYELVIEPQIEALLLVHEINSKNVLMDETNNKSDEDYKTFISEGYEIEL